MVTYRNVWHNITHKTCCNKGKDKDQHNKALQIIDMVMGINADFHIGQTEILYFSTHKMCKSFV